MSVKHIAWAFEQDISIPGAKLVLIALADSASAESGTTFAGQLHLATKTSQGVRTVRRHLDWLERAGFISRSTRRRRNGSKTSDCTTLNSQHQERENDD